MIWLMKDGNNVLWKVKRKKFLVAISLICWCLYILCWTLWCTYFRFLLSAVYHWYGPSPRWKQPYHAKCSVTLFIKMPTSGFSNLLLFYIISMFWESILQASFWLTNILFLALSAGDTVNDVSGLTCDSSIELNRKNSCSGFNNSTFNNKRTNRTIETFFHAKKLSFWSSCHFRKFWSY